MPKVDDSSGPPCSPSFAVQAGPWLEAARRYDMRLGSRVRHPIASRWLSSLDGWRLRQNRLKFRRRLTGHRQVARNPSFIDGSRSV